MTQGVYFDENSITISSPNLAKAISFIMPSGSNYYLKEISLNPDSSFQGVGLWQLFINGQSYMSAKPLPTALTISLWNFNNLKGVWVRPGDKIEIYASCSSGSGVITASVTGEPTQETQ